MVAGSGAISTPTTRSSTKASTKLTKPAMSIASRPGQSPWERRVEELHSGLIAPLTLPRWKWVMPTASCAGLATASARRRAVLPGRLDEDLVRVEGQPLVQEILGIAEAFHRARLEVIGDRWNAFTATGQWSAGASRAGASGSAGLVAVTFGHAPIIASPRDPQKTCRQVAVRSAVRPGTQHGYRGTL